MTEQPNPTILERISLKHMFAVFMGILNLERGILLTMWRLTVAPGKALREYMFTD